MGREARRVPLDFDWPIGEVWEGYLMPDNLSPPECDDCDGTGTTSAHQWVAACASMILLLTDDLRAQEQGRPMHSYFDEFSSVAYGTRPTPDIAELTEGLAGRSGLRGMGHDALDRWAATDKIIEAAGLDPKAWGKCQACAGHGDIEAYPGQRAEAEAWEPTDPPTGEGWQMWQTTSEGSPQTPVFATAEELADYCAETKASWFGSTPASREDWLNSFTGSAIGGMVQIAPGVVMM